VAFQSSLGTGGDCSGTATFSKDDFKVADLIAACAVRDHNIDPCRIYTTGCSAGGLQSGCMAALRSSYLAAAVPNSGGEIMEQPIQDSSHIPAIMTMHGGSTDVVVVAFSTTSATLDGHMKGRVGSWSTAITAAATAKPCGTLHCGLGIHAGSPVCGEPGALCVRSAGELPELLRALLTGDGRRTGFDLAPQISAQNAKLSVAEAATWRFTKQNKLGRSTCCHVRMFAPGRRVHVRLYPEPHVPRVRGLPIRL